MCLTGWNMKLKTAEEFAASIAYCDNNARIRAFEEALGQAALVIRERMEVLRCDINNRARLHECALLLHTLAPVITTRLTQDSPADEHALAGVSALRLTPGFTKNPNWQTIVNEASRLGIKIEEGE